ncbi:MAG: hypothetical protein Q8L60_16685 [Gammaproteobacteria bacterium]|nr:hypothetical protein [Gammaproteobacteria bacterium]MDP2349062.1 hypothetical protein [Gammaproteobacteria bacterium]
MDIIYCKEIDVAQFGKTGTGKIYAALVRISDVKQRAQEMVVSITNTSWLDNLDIVSKTSFEASSSRTISRLAEGIFAKVDDTITEEFGEYMVSDTAQSLLEAKLNHKKFPLAELLKEKVTGNPGFDFHTETSSQFLAFGEAKYSGSVNPYSKAIEQILDFIELKKDASELIVLKPFATPAAINNFLLSKKVFVAAFSVNSETPEKIISNLLASAHIDHFLGHEEFYIVGVNVESK